MTSIGEATVLEIAAATPPIKKSVTKSPFDCYGFVYAFATYFV